MGNLHLSCVVLKEKKKAEDSFCCFGGKPRRVGRPVGDTNIETN